jgi:hypothetical protein
VAPNPPVEGGHSVAPWVLAGAGGAVLVTGAVLLAVGSGDVSSANKACPDRSACPSSTVAAQGNRGRALETAGVVVGIAGIAGIAGGLVWHFADSKSRSSATAGLTTSLSPVVAPRFAGVALGGSF